MINPAFKNVYSFQDFKFNHILTNQAEKKIMKINHNNSRAAQRSSCTAD